MSTTRGPSRGPGRENRLARSSSPYLLQHARNPVDWFPWGHEAFELARSRDVPIFVSVGYSTCYWCHVMERESFEDDATAQLMNERFVCVKVDREERPDVDEVLMAATVLMTGQGGWPMSVFLEPATLRPFWCGTYFPKDPRFAGRPTFRQVLSGMSAAYISERESVRTQAQRLAEAVTQQLATHTDPAPLDTALVETALSRLLSMLDGVQGGFGTAPKFPQPVFLEFLFDMREMAGDTATRDAIDRAIRLTLDKMALGGVHDQVGGGFHRYSVDATWTVPHFEKMLYDNAQLLSVYARGARAFDDALHARTARRIIAYLRREMTDPLGGWWSAQDAEVHAREGLNYLWTPAQVQASLEDDLAGFACAALSIEGEQNFQDPHHQDEPAAWIPRLSARPELLAARMLMTDREFADRLTRACDALLEARAKRDQPSTDDKTLACWNGLMLAALARSASELDQPELLREALRTFDALTARLLRADGVLLRGVRAQTPAGPGFLEDSGAMLLASAAIARGLSTPEEAPDRARVLETAQLLYARARADFAQGDVWHDTRADAPDLFVRSRSTHDGAVPSGFSMIVHAMLDLWELTGDDSFRRDAVAALAARSGDIAHSPVGAINSVRAVARLLRTGAGDFPDAPRTPEAQPGAGAEGVVEVYASVDRVTLRVDQPASLTLALTIAPGYHVVAAAPVKEPTDDPAIAALIPLRVGIVSGGGVKAYADYPEGEPFSMAGGVLPEVRVHHGRVEFTVALEREGEWTGRPLLFVRFQACSNQACLSPVTVELDIALDRA